MSFCYFITGRGSVLTLNGTVEMEAQVIEGKNLNAGYQFLLFFLYF